MIGEVFYSTQVVHTWLIDSGVTFHVTSNIEWFSNYSPDANGKVHPGNGQSVILQGT